MLNLGGFCTGGPLRTPHFPAAAAAASAFFFSCFCRIISASLNNRTEILENENASENSVKCGSGMFIPDPDVLKSLGFNKNKNPGFPESD
jgi:hypothetical protein